MCISLDCVLQLDLASVPVKLNQRGFLSFFLELVKVLEICVVVDL